MAVAGGFMGEEEDFVGEDLAGVGIAEQQVFAVAWGEPTGRVLGARGRLAAVPTAVADFTVHAALAPADIEARTEAGVA